MSKPPEDRQPLAHVAEDGGVHPLDDHLKGTAQLAGEFAAEFGCSGWGYLAGLWHDMTCRLNTLLFNRQKDGRDEPSG